MNIYEATAQYETWAAQHLTLVPADLALKHARMGESRFAFLRATFYRWMQRWEQVCPALAGAPRVLSVGDLHVENFGTWRDAEGRLVWGINDFDEAHELPYAQDLVRLAASALVAAHDGHLDIMPHAVCEAIVAGYREALAGGGQPFVLEEHHGWLRELAFSELRDPVRFWKKFDDLPAVSGALPPGLEKLLSQDLPEPRLPCRIVHRVAGLGSLGRPRFVALAQWHGGMVAREAKGILPSACAWARAQQGAGRLPAVWLAAVRCQDPFLRVAGGWLLRRLAPHCSRIELSSLPGIKDEAHLLRAMGWEAANVHLGTRGAADRIGGDLATRPAGWLREGAQAMVDGVTEDWHEWKSRPQAV